MRYIAVVHTWKDGRIDYAGVVTIDGSRHVQPLASHRLRGKPRYMDGDKSPPWLQERVALLRLCDIGSGGDIGEKISDNILYVYLNRQEEYEQLLNLTGAEE